MIVIKMEAYNTTVDAAIELGVSTKTIREYIQKGIIPPPPEITYGVRNIKHFPPEYMKLAREYLDRYRDKKV